MEKRYENLPWKDASKGLPELDGDPWKIIIVREEGIHLAIGELTEIFYEDKKQKALSIDGRLMCGAMLQGIEYLPE